MKQHRTSMFFLLMLIYIWNIVLRYPDINGPHDADAYSVMTQIDTIDDEGYNPWILSPLSYFGMYPYSDTFGIQHFMVAMIQITGIHLDSAVFLIGLFLSFIALNSILILSNKINGKLSCSVFTVLSFTSSSYFFNYTFWSLSTRGPFLCFLPLFFLSLLSISKKHTYVKFSSIVISIFLFLLLLCTHRMYTFVVFTVLLPFCVFSLLNWYIKRNKVEKYYANRIFNVLILAIIFSLVILTSLFSKYFKNLGIPLDELWITDKFDIIYIGSLLNLAFTYLSAHLLSIFVIFGALTILLRSYLSFHYRFLTLVALFSSPFFINYEYFFPVGLTIVAVISGIGLQAVFEKIHSNYSSSKAIAFVLVVLLVLLPYTYHIKQLKTNIQGERHNIETISGYGLYPESYAQGYWVRENIPPDKVIIDAGRSDSIFWIVENNRVYDFDLMVENPELRDIIRVEPYNTLSIIFHYRGNIHGAYQYGGLVYDWSGVYSGSMPQNVHSRVMLLEPESYYHNIYEPKYAIEYRPHKIGDSFPVSPYFNQLEEKNYKISENDLWTVYFVREDYS